MTTDQPEATAPFMPERGNHAGRVRVALSIGAVAALFASYFMPWSHGDYPPPDNTPYVPVTAIFDPRQGVNLYAVVWMVGLPLLSALFALLTLRGSHEARRLFANFGLMSSFMYLASTVLITLGWSWSSQVADAGWTIGFLASALIFGVALSLSIALPGSDIPSSDGV